MKITDRSPKPVVVPAPTTQTAPVAPKNEVQAPKTATPAADASSTFSSAPAAAPRAPVSLQAPSAAPARGPLALTSPEARAAVQSSVDFLQKKAGNGLVPGADMSKAVTPRSVERDSLGMTHVRLDRTHEGTKVFGEQVISHLDKDGKVADMTGNVSKIPAGLGKDPVKLSAKDALAVAQKDFGTRTDPDRPSTAERVIAQDKDGNYRAAYHVEMNHMHDLKADERPRRMNYLIDANTGETIESYNQMGGVELPGSHGAEGAGHAGHAHAARAEGAEGGWEAEGPKGAGDVCEPDVEEPAPELPKAGDDISLYSGTVDLSTTKQADGKYTLEDSTRGKGVMTYDGKNAPRPSGATQMTDANNTWGEATDDPRTKSAVDAHYGAQMTYDFLKDVLGRDSIDGKGEALKSYVHTDKNLVNAFWDGTKMSYGDGDGKRAGPLTTLDIAGHEIAHGLTERTAGLIYSGESGGLNEAFSDIIGTGVEWYASQKNKAVEFDWKMGEDAWTPGNGTDDALRYMNDPTKDNYSIDHYKNYPKQKEVHGSSGIANNAFFLTVEGGTNRTSGMKVDGGIGMEKGLKIYGRALEHYMTPRTTFAEARAATIKAATDLYGADSAEVKKVQEGWSAVGVGV